MYFINLNNNLLWKDRCIKKFICIDQKLLIKYKSIVLRPPQKKRPAHNHLPLEAELAGVAANEGRMPVNCPDGHLISTKWLRENFVYKVRYSHSIKPTLKALKLSDIEIPACINTGQANPARMTDLGGYVMDDIRTGLNENGDGSLEALERNSAPMF